MTEPKRISPEEQKKAKDRQRKEQNDKILRDMGKK